MSGDYSRFGFDPTKNYASVLLQQGRPLTDRDWNDEAILTARRAQAESFDTLGQAVVPSSTPNGFAITFDSSGNLQIGQGRMYVDGLLVENHGTWYGHLGSGAGRDLRYKPDALYAAALSAQSARSARQRSDRHRLSGCLGTRGDAVPGPAAGRVRLSASIPLRAGRPSGRCASSAARRRAQPARRPSVSPRPPAAD